ncbi:MAG: hypothetical protein ACP5PT_08200 [Brevinematia bacterium]
MCCGWIAACLFVGVMDCSVFNDICCKVDFYLVFMLIGVYVDWCRCNNVYMIQLTII